MNKKDRLFNEIRNVLIAINNMPKSRLTKRWLKQALYDIDGALYDIYKEFVFEDRWYEE